MVCVSFRGLLSGGELCGRSRCESERKMRCAVGRGAAGGGTALSWWVGLASVHGMRTVYVRKQIRNRGDVRRRGWGGSGR